MTVREAVKMIQFWKKYAYLFNFDDKKYEVQTFFEKKPTFSTLFHTQLSAILNNNLDVYILIW